MCCIRFLRREERIGRVHFARNPSHSDIVKFIKMADDIRVVVGVVQLSLAVYQTLYDIAVVVFQMEEAFVPFGGEHDAVENRLPF
jgi:hypothetical protein